jgi:hypothetical protein
MVMSTTSSKKKKIITGLDPILVAKCENRFDEKHDVTVKKIEKGLKLLEDLCVRAKKKWYLAFLLKTGQLNYSVNYELWVKIKKLMPDIKATKINVEGEIRYYIDISEVNCKGDDRPESCEKIRRNIDNHYHKALVFLAKYLNLIKIGR